MKFLLILLVPLLMMHPVSEPQKGKIIYVYDPLCGWCYGFSPVMQKLQETHGKDYAFEVVSGGMVTGDRVGPLSDMAAYISQAYLRVEDMTGVTFGEPFLQKTLKEGTAMLNSVPGSIALSVFKTQQPEKSIAFASALQKSLYFYGQAPEDLPPYGGIAQTFGLDSADFVKKMQEPQYLQLAEQDFARSAQLRVTGFPTVFLETPDGKRKTLANGWTAYDKIVSQL